MTTRLPLFLLLILPDHSSPLTTQGDVPPKTKDVDDKKAAPKKAAPAAPAKAAAAPAKPAKKEAEEIMLFGLSY